MIINSNIVFCTTIVLTVLFLNRFQIPVKLNALYVTTSKIYQVNVKEFIKSRKNAKIEFAKHILFKKMIFFSIITTCCSKLCISNTYIKNNKSKAKKEKFQKN